MFIASLAAAAHGGMLPAFTIIFGRFINTFLNQEITQGIATFFSQNFDINSSDIDCNDTSVFNSVYFDRTVSDITNGTLNCSYVIVQNVSTYESIIKDCNGGVVDCSNNANFISEINKLAYVFIGIAVAVFILAFLQISLFQAACERQVKKICLAFYRAIMRQEIGWFDANPTGELSSRLAEYVLCNCSPYHIEKIHNVDYVGLIQRNLVYFSPKVMHDQKELN